MLLSCQNQQSLIDKLRAKENKSMFRLVHTGSNHYRHAKPLVQQKGNSARAQTLETATRETYLFPSRRRLRKMNY